MLCVDNHNSHITTQFMYECFIHDIQLAYLPSHSTHVLQPLDVGCFRCLSESIEDRLLIWPGTTAQRP